MGKFWDALMRRSRQVDAEAAKKVDVANPEKQRQILEDANQEINKFENSLAELCASRKSKEKQLVALQAEVVKYEGFAQRAGAANDETNVRAAVTKKINFQTQVDSLNKQIDLDSQLETKLKAQLRDARDKVAAAESKAQTLNVRENSAKIRQALASNSTSKSGSALSQLNEWEKEVDKAESLAEAKEELAGASSTDKELEDKYSGTNEAVDAEMAKYLKPSSPANA